MKDYAYSNVDQDLLDRKMRNMKRSYKTIKDNNKKSTTGRGRVSWQYYEMFEDIFTDDLTINHRPTLQSALRSSMSNPRSSNVPFEDEIEDPDNPILSTNLIVNSCAEPLPDLESIAPAEDLRSVSPLSRPLSVTSGNSTSSAENKNKSLYNLRKKQINIEEKRMEAIVKLKESLDESNKIQRERNDLIKQFFSSQLCSEK